MICNINHTLTVKVFTEDLLASTNGLAHDTGYVVNLTSRHKI